MVLLFFCLFSRILFISLQIILPERLMRKTYYNIFALFVVITIVACSTEHNTWYSRHYQMLTSQFNVLFNGNEAFKSGIDNIRSKYKNDYSQLLPIYEFSDQQAANAGTADMETALKKAHKLIQLHSITVKPEQKQDETEKDKRFRAQEEFNNLVDDAYLLIGKSNVVKHEEEEAIEVLDYIARKFPNNKTAYEGKIWKAIAYTQLGQPTNAKTALESYEIDGLAPTELYGQYMAAYANVLLAEKKYTEAIPYMEEAVKNADCKHNRLRYKYILAQLYRMQGKRELAAPIFLQLSKTISDYEMSFAAKLDLASVATTPEEIAIAEKKLEKMAADEKNTDQLDEIYYAIGRMDENKGNRQKALIDYQKSIDASVSNDNQRGLSFLAKADIYTTEQDDATDKYNNRYINASESLDSASIYLSDANLRKKETEEMSKRLLPLANELRIIKEQDSLLTLARMPEQERDKIITAIVEKAEQEAKARLEAQEAAEEEMMSQSDFYNLQRNTTGEINNRQQLTSSWYFYNTNLVNAGKSTFRNKWGRRQNEDNWRRANKSSQTFNAENENNINSESALEPDKKRQFDTEDNDEDISEKPTERVTRESLLANLPLTAEQQKAANAEIDDALFNSGVILYDELKDYHTAIKQLKLLLSRNIGYSCDRCYNALVILYFAQAKTSQKTDAQSTAAIIKRQFANTQFAQYLSQNDYFDKKSLTLAESEARYGHTYDAYLNGQYEEAASSATHGLNVASDSVYAPKYLLVRSLSHAKMAHTTQFRADLTEITTKYAGGEEDELARKLLAMLDEGKEPIRATEYKSPLAEAGMVTDDNNKLLIANFEYKPDTTHSVICVIDEGMANEAQFVIADYNFTNYIIEDLDIKAMTLADKRQVIIISGLENETAAKTYYYSLRDKEFWKNITSASIPEIYIASDNNTKLALLSTLSKEFVEFFEKYYLKK